MFYSKSVYDIIPARKSVRTYAGQPVAKEIQHKIEDFLINLPGAPLGSKARFMLAAAAEGDTDVLKGLGTYGMIRRPAGFIIGAVEIGACGLFDFGYLMETVVLFLSDMGLGSCWLGGTFKKSQFSDRISATADEVVPAVLSTGLPAQKPRMIDRLVRSAANSDKRKPWSEIFFVENFQNPFPQEGADPFARILEMVRLAPSASNRQPWKIVRAKDKPVFHFFLMRDEKYNKQLKRLKRIDLQKVDMGIAACHFDWSVKEIGMSGNWKVEDPLMPVMPANTEYVISWHRS